MIPELAHFPINPAYGTGIYRRRLQFVAGAAGVTGQVDDTHHSYWLSLDHDGTHITGIEAGFNRAPTNMCIGSVAGLQALVGQPLFAPARDFLARLPQPANCTHLADLALWAMSHVSASALWEIRIPDQVDQPIWIDIRRNDKIIHHWQIADFHVTAPCRLAGNPLMSGFRKWAAHMFAGDALLAATMLQRGIFVARGRRHIVDQGEPTPLANAAGMVGMCRAYSGEYLSHGVGTLDYVRDFTATVQPEIAPRHIDQRLKGIES